MRIGIIGTGVAGSLLAQGLAGRPGIKVVAFERTVAGEHDEAGTGLNLGPNALKALRLHAPGQHAALRAASLPWRTWTVSLADGTVLLSLDLLAHAEEEGARLRWAELYRVLRAPVAAWTQHGLTLDGIEEDAAGRLVPVFRCQTAGCSRFGGFDLLVAADGRYSRTRALVAGEPAPDMMGLCMWRLLVPDGAGCPFDDFGQWFNGRNRLLAYRLPGGAVYVAGAFALPADGLIPAGARTAAAQRALFEPDGGVPCPAVAWMLDQVEARFEHIHWARSQTSPMLRMAGDGRVLLLGDAAHGMVPTLGQGATQAIEDGVVAASILREGGDAAAVAAARDERVGFVRDFSVEASDTMMPGSDPVAGTLAKGGAAFGAKLRRLWTDV